MGKCSYECSQLPYVENRATPATQRASSRKETKHKIIYIVSLSTPRLDGFVRGAYPHGDSSQSTAMMFWNCASSGPHRRQAPLRLDIVIAVGT